MQPGQLIPLIKTVHAATFIELLRNFETDIYPLLKTAGLPDDILRGKHEFIPEKPVKHLLGLMAERAEPERYGDLLRTLIQTYFIPKMLRHLTNPQTLGEAIFQLKTAIRHDSPSASIDLEYFNHVPWFCRYKQNDHSTGFLWAEIFSILFLIEFIRMAGECDWQPASIAIQSDDAGILAAVINCPETVLYAKRRLSAVELSESLLNSPFNLPARFDSIQQVPPHQPNFIESLYLALTPYLGQQSFTIEQAAELMNTSVRTLQRRLSDEGTTFKQVRENIMLTTACQMMEDKQFSLTDIATELGYADIAHFSRAFKKLTGFPPRIYRQRFL
ncbi:AraC family transcriptional regulator [Photobacterium aquae]|uniref:AraC family transcriptional regulator n=1 Tax=Photobacterium aquae TaxID=1195763 RepID=A0A0J1H5D6_9GAMM|nr:helix-turn-helix transcriptional regulator [Photobacterium aquae]KLV06916.1 AraC family transcriptional regulator [Photobacterium aquae]